SRIEVTDHYYPGGPDLRGGSFSGNARLAPVEPRHLPATFGRRSSRWHPTSEKQPRHQGHWRAGLGLLRQSRGVLWIRRNSLLLTGGRVIDPANRFDAVADVLIRDGKI